MIKKVTGIYFFLVSLVLITAASCNVAGDDCGPFDDKFRTVNFTASIQSISISDDPGLYVDYESPESDTLSFDRFGLSMFPVQEFYTLNERVPSFSIFPKAYACSPAIPVSEEMITDLKVYSNSNFNSEYSAGENLAPLFEVVVLYRNSGYRQFELNEFLASEPHVPDELFLILKEAPDTAATIQFTVSYSQDGTEMKAFEFTSEPIVLTDRKD
ncbi:hypothetical protein [Gracilimonas tropica]|uniref:hypothetical protein n=1 Tax=Gracilimonas tropica TaxID=454600 RepID=UPI00036E8147|nr:hypothetical protein [Gracilimonas tropica]